MNIYWLPKMNYSPKNLKKLLEEKGWILKRIKGSHHIYIYPKTGETLPVPIHGNRDMAKGTFFSILKQAGIDKDEV